MASMRAFAACSLIVVLLTLTAAADVAGASLGSEAYRLPLVDPYAIYREASDANSNKGMCRLVEVHSSSRGVGLSFSEIVTNVEQVGLEAKVIAGKADKGYFVLDTRQPNPQPQVYASFEEWKSALAAAGIITPIPLAQPDAMTAGQPEGILRPWKYRMMGGRLGYSDDAWSLIVQLAGLGVAFVVGLASLRRSPVLAAVVLGLIVNVVAQIVIAGGGPGAFVGFFILPLACCVAASLGKGIRWVAEGLLRRRKASAASTQM